MGNFGLTEEESGHQNRVCTCVCTFSPFFWAFFLFPQLRWEVLGDCEDFFLFPHNWVLALASLGSKWLRSKILCHSWNYEWMAVTTAARFREEMINCCTVGMHDGTWCWYTRWISVAEGKEVNLATVWLQGHNATYDKVWREQLCQVTLDTVYDTQSALENLSQDRQAYTTVGVTRSKTCTMREGVML